MIIKKKNGYTVVELVFVVGVMALLIAIGGTFSTKIFARRSVDNISNSITSQLNLIKLQSSREGVEFQATLTYTPANPSTNPNNNLEIVATRGDSARNANFNVLNEVSNVDFRILDEYTITPANSTITFSPTGNLNAGITISLIPNVPEADAIIRKCGIINVNNLGRISTTIGRWDFSDMECEGLGDIQDN